MSENDYNETMKEDAPVSITNPQSFGVDLAATNAVSTVDGLVAKIGESISIANKNLPKLNIIIAGKSGAGKSTLINSIFRGEFAKTGIGHPVTEKIRKLEKADFPLAIYDTPGLELDGEQQTKLKQEILDIIEGGNCALNDAIHCVWYCINVAGNRIEESEIQWLKEFTDANSITQVPVIVVLTQAVPKEKAAEMKGLLEKENLNVVKVIPLLAQDMDFNEEYIAKAYGLDTLIDVMTEVLPVSLQTTLQNIQKVSLEAKKKAARKAIVAGYTAAFGAGYTPLPFSDAIAIVPVQVTMLAAITVIFGLKLDATFLTGLCTALFGCAGATYAGRAFVSGLLKLIPGAGSVAGGTISGTTAALLTKTLGESYIKIMEKVSKGELTEKDVSSEKCQEMMKKIFMEGLKNAK